MMRFIKICACVAVMLSAAASVAFAHSERGEKRPQTYEEAFIPLTKDDLKLAGGFRHPPGNVRVDDMLELFSDKVLVVDRSARFSSDPAVINHAVKVIFLGKDGRYIWCSYGSNFNYFVNKHNWEPSTWKHRRSLFPLLDTATAIKGIGNSPLYNGNTGQIIWYGYYQKKKRWITWNPGHLQERLPAVVYTLCPEFPSPEELGVKVNSKQTAVTYDKLLEQDLGRRVLRPDLITLNPVETVK